MKYEIVDCIDAGTEYCPCHLAETGDCILCSELCNKTFCDCINWKGTCIYQEFIWNGNKAKEDRKCYLCKILNKSIIDEKLLIISIEASQDLIQPLVHPGSYVFLRNPNYKEYFDAPISIMDLDSENNTITFAIEINGVKTKKIEELNIEDNIMLRGPYWNGVLGLRNILKASKGNSIIIARSIGLAPMLPVLKKLYSNENNITVIIDKAEYKEIFTKEYLKKYNIELIEISTFEGGDLTKEFKNLLLNVTKAKNPNIIHCAGADILIYKILELLGDEYNYSCCNNAKMCCGEGVCGACTVRFKGHVIKRLCKLQVEPKYLFEGRRLI